MLLIALVLTAAPGAVADSGRVIVADARAWGGVNMVGGVVAVDPVTGARSWLSSNDHPDAPPYFAHPPGIAVSPSGAIFTINHGIPCCGGVVQIDPATGARTAIGGNLEDPAGFAVEAGEETIVIADTGEYPPGSIHRLDLASGTMTALSRNWAPAGEPSFSYAGPVGVAVEAAGTIVAADPGALDGTGAIIRVDPVGGARTLVSANGLPAGGPDFEDPAWIAVEADGNLLVTDGGRVIGIDPVTGAHTTCRRRGCRRTGPPISRASGIAVDESGRVLVAGVFGGVPGVMYVDRHGRADGTVAQRRPRGRAELRVPGRHRGRAVEPQVREGQAQGSSEEVPQARTLIRRHAACSATATRRSGGFALWAIQDSNLGPLPYQRSALTD